MARVLVVDDERTIRMLCRINLELAGFDVVEAEDGQSALASVRSEKPDLILLDLMMPAPDGWQVAEELQEDEATRAIPIIFVTARNTLRDKSRAFGIGAVDYVVKPFDPVALASLVDKTLARLARGEREDIRREWIDDLRAQPA